MSDKNDGSGGAAALLLLLLLGGGGFAAWYWWDEIHPIIIHSPVIDVIVRNDETQAVISGATVAMMANSVPMSTKTTDVNGVASFADMVLVGDSVDLDISADGYSDVSLNFTVQEGLNTVNVSLIPMPSPTPLSVTVYDELLNKAADSGITVTIMDYDAGTEIATAVTGTDGSVLIEDVLHVGDRFYVVVFDETEPERYKSKTTGMFTVESTDLISVPVVTISIWPPINVTVWLMKNGVTVETDRICTVVIYDSYTDETLAHNSQTGGAVAFDQSYGLTPGTYVKMDAIVDGYQPYYNIDRGMIPKTTIWHLGFTMIPV